MRIDIEEIRQLVADGLVTMQKHPSESLSILNYTQQCQFTKKWTPTTLMCRGLIVDSYGHIVARPFPKFFNIEEHALPDTKLPPIPWHEPFAATDKVDGSLGIIYHGADGLARIATRGSFLSVQAKRATAMLVKLGYFKFKFDRTKTYLFEIVYPENRIVCDYGDQEDLVLLDVIDNETGYGASVGEIAITSDEIGCPFVEHFPLYSAEAVRQFVAGNNDNREGLVLKFESGFRVKAKFADYVRLHRLLTGLTPRHIWEHLRDGRSIDEILGVVPDEFFGWVRDTKRRIEADYAERERATKDFMLFGNQSWTRKEWAAHFSKQPDLAPIGFKILDGRDYSDVIWKQIKPEPASAYACAE